MTVITLSQGKAYCCNGMINVNDITSMNEWMFNCDFFLIIFYVHLLLYSLCCKVEHRVKTVSQILFFAYIEVNYFTRWRIVFLCIHSQREKINHIYFVQYGFLINMIMQMRVKINFLIPKKIFQSPKRKRAPETQAFRSFVSWIPTINPCSVPSLT